MCIRLCTVILQCRIIYYDDSVCAVCAKLICLSLDVGTDQNCGYFLIQVFCKLLCLADQLKCDAPYYSVYLLGKHIYSLIFFDIHISHLVLN